MTDHDVTMAVAEYLARQGFRCRVDRHSTNKCSYLTVFVWGEIFVWVSVYDDLLHLTASKSHVFQVVEPNSLDRLMDQIWKSHESHVTGRHTA